MLCILTYFQIIWPILAWNFSLYDKFDTFFTFLTELKLAKQDVCVGTSSATTASYPKPVGKPYAAMFVHKSGEFKCTAEATESGKPLFYKGLYPQFKFFCMQLVQVPHST